MMTGKERIKAHAEMAQARGVKDPALLAMEQKWANTEAEILKELQKEANYVLDNWDLYSDMDAPLYGSDFQDFYENVVVLSTM